VAARRAVTGTVAAVALLMAGPAAAQVPVTSARAQGMGTSYTAVARGFSAVRWNPAALGLATNPWVSVALAPVRGVAGLDPIGTNELAEWDDRLVPDDIKRDWLDTITEAGSERGSAGAEVTAVALSIGRFGFQYGVIVDGELRLAPDAAELILFGNAGLTGDPRPFEFSGSTITGSVTSTAALSYGQPLPVRLGLFPDERVAVGITLKHTMGHAIVVGRDVGSRASADPIEVDIAFPIIHPDTVADFPEFGSGWGLDLGAAWEAGPWSAGLVLRNLVQTFQWEPEGLRYTPASALFTTDTASSSFEERPIDEAPAALIETLEALTYEPEIAAGIGWTGRYVTLTADLRHRLDDGIQAAPRTHAGFGAEIRPVPFLPLRLGAAAVAGGYLLTGGLGIDTGPVNLGASVGVQDSDLGEQTVVAVALSFGER
jgi:hypothetical protein